LEDESFRSAIAGAIALEPEGDSTVVIEAGDTFDLDATVAKADEIAEAWVIEIPAVGGMFELLAKRAGVSVFYVDEIPGSLFATTEKLAAGKSRVLVADGQIGVPAKGQEAAASNETASLGKRVTKVLKTAEERYVLGIVLVPETVDSQGDIYSHEEVRKAAHEYMETAGNLGKQHTEIVTGKLKILETYLAPADFTMDEESVTKGTWLMGIRVVDDGLWDDVKKGAFSGFSIGGAAHRSPEITTPEKA
jgi:hypothetical protein